MMEQQETKQSRWKTLWDTFEGIIAVLVFSYLIYGYIESIVLHWDLPSGEVQTEMIKKAIAEVNIKSVFQGVDNEPFIFSGEKMVGAHKLFYIMDTKEKTMEIYIKAHKAKGWELYKDKEREPRYEDREVDLVKGKLRTHMSIKDSGDKNKFFISYDYRDGIFEK